MARVVIDPVCTGLFFQGVPFDTVNLRLGRWVRDYLMQVLPQNDVAMTRQSSAECPVALETRMAIANQPDVQALVSVGINNFPDNPDVCGMEVFHAGSPNGTALASAVFNATTPLRQKWGINVRRGGIAVVDFDFPMITDTRPPATFILPGFVTCPEDYNDIINTTFQREFGYYVARGIASYLGLGTITFEFPEEEPPPEDEPPTQPPEDEPPTQPPPQEEQRNLLPWLLLAAGAGVGIAYLITRQ